MDLTTLKSSTLKLYLVLASRRDETGHCRLSQRQLSHVAGLARNTLIPALHQLEHHQLIVTQKESWTVDLAPLATLIAPPAAAATGSKIEPVVSPGGSKTEPVAPQSGSKIEPPAPASNACARTPSTSSSEEVTTLPILPGRKEKLAVPEADPAEGEFAACWQNLAPGGALPSQEQLKALQKEVGADLVLTVARSFLMAGRRLSGLKNPAKAWNYFCRACQSEARTGRRPVQAILTQSPPPTPTRSMVELYLQQRSCA